MNQVILTGRLSKKPELRETKKGSKVCEFTLATNRPTMRDGKREADFITCMVWNNQAENLVKYQDKGSLIGVHGELRIDSYEVNGEKRYKTYVIVNNIEFLDRKSESTTQSTTPIQTNPYEDFGKSIKTEVQEQFDYKDEDFPF